MGATGKNLLANALGIRFVDTRDRGRRVKVLQSMIINRQAAELYSFWRDFRNLSRIMPYLRSVEILSEQRSHWVTEAPAGFIVEWDAEIVNEMPDTLIAWQSWEGSDVVNWGVVRFAKASGGRGTEVTVESAEGQPRGPERKGLWSGG
jgi:uncharacterized membrane protein